MLLARTQFGKISAGMFFVMCSSSVQIVVVNYVIIFHNVTLSIDVTHRSNNSRTPERTKQRRTMLAQQILTDHNHKLHNQLQNGIVHVTYSPGRAWHTVPMRACASRGDIPFEILD